MVVSASLSLSLCCPFVGLSLSLSLSLSCSLSLALSLYSAQSELTCSVYGPQPPQHITSAAIAPSTPPQSQSACKNARLCTRSARAESPCASCRQPTAQPLYTEAGLATNCHANRQSASRCATVCRSGGMQRAHAYRAIEAEAPIRRNDDVQLRQPEQQHWLHRK